VYKIANIVSVIKQTRLILFFLGAAISDIGRFFSIFQVQISSHYETQPRHNRLSANSDDLPFSLLAFLAACVLQDTCRKYQKALSGKASAMQPWQARPADSFFGKISAL